MVGPEGSDSCRIRYLPPLPTTVVIYYSAGTITVPKNRKGYLYYPGSILSPHIYIFLRIQVRTGISWLFWIRIQEFRIKIKTISN